MTKIRIRKIPRTEQEILAAAKRIKGDLEKKRSKSKISAENIDGGHKDAARLIYLFEEYGPKLQKNVTDFVAHKKNAAWGVGTEVLELPEDPDSAAAPEARRPGMLNRLLVLDEIMKMEDKISGVIDVQEEQAVAIKNGEEHPYTIFFLKIVQGTTHKIIHIIFKKHGHHGVLIETRIFGEEWQVLATDTSSPHIDDRPPRDPNLPEIREYRLRFWQDGAPTGDWSPVQSVTLLP